MELLNKRVMYTVKNQDSNLKLEGDAQITGDNVITTFSGSFFTLEDVFTGGFSYAEEGDGLINKSVNSYPSSLEDKGMKLLDATVTALKQQLTV
jgi:hypothetical protein|nr:MAG TPA: hypothetical protein [Caudoviricetes sp.]DAQ75695.1 MAG TPA: hypothetical protein [Caudoviricetes sp.]